MNDRIVIGVRAANEKRVWWRVAPGAQVCKRLGDIVKRGDDCYEVYPAHGLVPWVSDLRETEEEALGLLLKIAGLEAA